VEELKTQKLPIVSKASPGCSVAVWSIVAGALALAVGLLWWWGRGRA
jgi:phosphate/sulfate permease